MTAALTAALLAVLVGPVVLLLGHRTMSTPSAPPWVEIAAVTAAAGLTMRMVIAQPPARAAVVVPLAVLGGAAALVDAREGRLPDALTGPLAVATLAAVLATGQDMIATILGAAAGTGVALALKLVADAAIGWGDVKLAPTLAAVLAHHGAVAAGVIAMALFVAATATILAALRQRAALVPYGPALVLGTLGAACG